MSEPPNNGSNEKVELSEAESKSGMQHYDKVRKLGQGSFGSVFLMRDRRDDIMCVMKAIDLDQLDAKGKQVVLRAIINVCNKYNLGGIVFGLSNWNCLH
jgi:hypothetical protein